MRRRLFVLGAVVGMTLFVVSTGWADVPPPPVNQTIGMYDGSITALTEGECRACHPSGLPDRHHSLYGEPIPVGSVVPYPDPDNDGTDETIYVCLSCHATDFTVVRDCLVCHTSSPHHSTATAQGGDCVACHGDIVDNMGDGHYIPDYPFSLVTPAREDCENCHDADNSVLPPILTNQQLHHGTGLLTVPGACNWCHVNGDGDDGTDGERIRTCEGCHGPEALHNIQADSNGDGNVVVGGELAGYGHVGRDAGPGDSDCWGCHGFAADTAPGSGPIIPSIVSSDVKATKAGTDTPVVLGGSAFTNIAGELLFTSDLLLTASDGSAVTLKPDTIVQDVLTATIPGTTAPGNYNLQAVKAEFASNPTVITITPEVVINGATVDGTTVTIRGSGFAGYAAGSGTSVTATGTTEEGTIISWTETTIVAEFASSPDRVTVNSVFGTATSEVGTGWTFRRGDSNGDGAVNLADAVHTLDHLFLGGPASGCPDASDSDDNGRLEITDAVLTLSWLFVGQGELASPGPEVCGPDLTEDALPACDYDPTRC